MKIGTRASAMAIAQTTEIVAQLKKAAPGVQAEIVKFKPRGDRDQISRLDRHGGKGGAFVAELRDAVRQGTLQAAMHSLKDVPGDEECHGLVLGAYLKREQVEDTLVLRSDHSLEAFEKARGAGYKIGTNSVRRGAFLKKLYPACDIIHYRGAANTRIQKLEDKALQKLPGGGAVGPADGLVMARCGLERVGLAQNISKIFSAAEMLPAIGQGIVTAECARTDWESRKLLAQIDDAETRICALAEREVLWVLNGHCNTPIAGRAEISDSVLRLRAAVLSLDGKTNIETSLEGDPLRPRELGREAGLALLNKGAAKLIAEANQ
ncbi:hydroxymethylbilane synthase [Hyphococcus sp.]|uniref:hydroxymethylbilane synthase n=1 Tax=Hyphococcus sp. TaxID=2038636 RepID=UPI003CCBCA2A